MLATVAYAAGGFPSSPWVVVLAVATSLAVLGRARLISKRAVGAGALVLVVSCLRAELAVGDASSRYERARRATTPPVACVLTGAVVASP
ncbi:MAG TPA: hypothetical protein VL400_12700, partial [Polyangiaceae bacterium]|nr:hypothetical protein [Polyangiaceae bacterium]